MDKKKVITGIGILAGLGAIAGFLLWKKSKKVEQLRMELFDYEPQSESSFPKQMQKRNKLVKQKESRASKLLKKLEAGRAYTQVEIQKLSKVPYRTVRRYVEELLGHDLLVASGYGKGKRFSKKNTNV